MAKSGLVDIAFLVDAHCDPVDVQKCQAYTKPPGGITVKGAPTTEQTSRRISLIQLKAFQSLAEYKLVGS